MTREEIRNRFRQEVPEATDRVLTDVQLNSWLLEGNINFCSQCRLITSTVTFDSVASQDTYNLMTEEPKFMDIDEFPGGGVAYNGKRIGHLTKAQLDNERKSWRSNENGTPKNYFRRGGSIIFDRPADASGTDIDVDCVLVPDDFNDDSKTPFNELVYLKPYHYGLVLYLVMRAKAKIGKDNDKANAQAEYQDYVAWCKKTIQGGTIGYMHLVPPSIGSLR